MRKNQVLSHEKCTTKYCRNRKQKKSRYCHRCEYRNKKEKYPLQHAYTVLKNNALRRGKVFTISFEYFCEFAIRVKYLKKKGIYAYSYHVDRIREELGYVEGNLQLLKNPDNVKKYLKWCQDERGKPGGFHTHIDTKVQEPDEDLPF